MAAGNEVQFSLRVSRGLARRLRQMAKANRFTVNQLLTQMIQATIASQELDAPARLVLLHLVRYGVSNFRSDPPPDATKLAGMARLTEEGVRQGVQTLVQAGFMEEGPIPAISRSFQNDVVVEGRRYFVNSRGLSIAASLY